MPKITQIVRGDAGIFNLSPNFLSCTFNDYSVCVCVCVCKILKSSLNSSVLYAIIFSCTEICWTFIALTNEQSIQLDSEMAKNQSQCSEAYGRH